MSLKLPAVRVRAWVVVGGAALGGALLVVTALIGGVKGTPHAAYEPVPDRLGPATAIQPELREALLDDQDLPDTPPPERSAAPTARPPLRKGAATGPPDPSAPGLPAVPVVPRPETGVLTDLCRALFEDPAGLAGLWQAPAKEVTSRHTARPGGAILDQVLGVFDGTRAVEAYHRLREAASGCARFETSLTDGGPVTLLLQELTGSRLEAAPADDSYALVISVEDGDRAGWFVMDRVGRVVSVLRYLGPTGADEDLTQLRVAALAKLQPLLRALAATEQPG